MKYFFGMLATVAVVAGATVVGYRAWDKATHTREDNGGVLTTNPVTATTAPGTGLADNQVALVGGVTAIHLEGATIDNVPTPVTITTAERGVGGATITSVLVGGQTTSIDWQAGQPLPLSGDGGHLLLADVVVDATPDGVTVVLDGVQGLTPGDYRIGTSVAVGSTPKDSVTFTVTDTTTAKFRGTASMPFEGELVTKGHGSISFDGSIDVIKPDGSKDHASRVELDQGLYTLTLTPTGNRDYILQAKLQGTVNVK